MLYPLAMVIHGADMLGASLAPYETRGADAAVCASSPAMCPERRLRSRVVNPSAAVD